MDDDADMTDAGPSPNRQRRDQNDAGRAKRMVVSGPERDQYDAVRDEGIRARARIQQLEAALDIQTALSKKAEEQAKAAQSQYDELRIFMDEHREHEGQLEMQFMHDQTQISELASNSGYLDGWLLTVPPESGIRARCSAADGNPTTAHGPEPDGRASDPGHGGSYQQNIDLKARLRAPSGPGTRVGRKGRAAKFPVLRNTSDTVQIPLDPVPLPATPAPSATQITTTITKKMKKAPVAPENRTVVNMLNMALRDTVYVHFGVTKQSDFMTHIPVSVQEMQASVVPAEGVFRWDFSTGYLNSRWNAAIISRIVKEVWKKARARIGLLLSTPSEWARLQPRAVGGRMETREEAGARALLYLEAQHAKNKSTSAKSRKYDVRILTITLTVQIKLAEGAGDARTWQRLLEIMEKLKIIGMSSEEEGKVEYNSQMITIYKVKICAWRAPEIADYLRLVDKQTEEFAKQTNGRPKALRATSDIVGTSAAPKGLPKCMYNAAWLTKLGWVELEDLTVSEEAFALLVAATSRMAISKYSKCLQIAQKHDDCGLTWVRTCGSQESLSSTKIQMSPWSVITFIRRAIGQQLDDVVKRPASTSCKMPNIDVRIHSEPLWYCYPLHDGRDGQIHGAGVCEVLALSYYD
ncbi:hypothetical protein B0H12DRAFT_1242413 [Mycena haematopus]|nr:hypothetical protein B0H12DRAFT_1242413 [Mycena haematopus]